MSETPAESVSPFTDPKTGALNTDCACLACGYNLRGLDASGRCPECSGSVAEALGALRALTSPTEWVAAVHAGLTFVRDGMQALTSGIIAALLLAAGSVTVDPGVVAACCGFTLIPVAIVATPIGMIVTLYGVAVVTRRPPDAVITPRAESLRRRARRLRTAFFVGIGVLIVAAALLPSIVLAFALAAEVACLYLWSLDYVRFVGALMDTWDRQVATTAAQGFAVLFGVALASCVLLGMFASVLASPAAPLPTYLFAGAAVTTLVATVASALHVLRLHRALRRELESVLRRGEMDAADSPERENEANRRD